MKTIYLDCSMGAAGDMLSAALFELLDDKEGFLKKFRSAGIPGVSVSPEEAVRCGIRGTHMEVLVDGVSEGEHDHEHGHHYDEHGHELHDHDHDHEHEHEHDHHHEHEHDHHDHHDHDHDGEHHHHDDHEHGHDHEHDHDHHHHHHAHPGDIEALVDGLDIPEKVKTDAKNIYALIAEAESSVHGVPVTEIHFHEVGTMDAVADVVMACLLMHEIAPGKVIASEVNAGSGTVHCAHGILPVPAPATAYLLKGIPFYAGRIKSELCTPTGAALLKYFVSSFGNMPVMQVEKTGYGMGKKDFEQANCVRAFLGESKDEGGTVIMLSCNLDDMTGEGIGFVMERLFEGGALDVYTVAAGMKKSRPGVVLNVICEKDLEEKMVSLIFAHTTTLGIRENVCRRFTLKREILEKETEFGTVRYKRSEGYGVIREKAEYEDLSRIAKEKGLPLEEIKKRL